MSGAQMLCDTLGEAIGRREGLRWLSALSIAMVLGSCGLFGGDPSRTVRYKMTIEVNTPQGVRTGSAVRDVVFQTQRGSDGTITTAHVHGEAVAIDLADGRTLFALLRGGEYGSDEDYAGWVISLAGLTKQGAIGSIIESPIEIYPDHPPVDELRSQDFVPMIVMFHDVVNPLNLKVLHARNLSADLGDGYALRRITLQRSSESITQSIYARLPWLKQMDQYDPLKIDKTFVPFYKIYPVEALNLRKK